MYLISNGASENNQTGCFIGGAPELPEALLEPECELCDATQTFFIQVAFPESHSHRGHSLAVFACTECASEDQLIPELPVPLKEAILTRQLLKEIQRNFCLLLFPTEKAVPRSGPSNRLERTSLILAERPSGNVLGNLTSPEWVLDDEAPSTCDGQPMDFLLSLREGVEYRPRATSPPQMILGLTGEPERDDSGTYDLFVRNALFFFACRGSDQVVYCIPQSA